MVCFLFLVEEMRVHGRKILVKELEIFFIEAQGMHAACWEEDIIAEGIGAFNDEECENGLLLRPKTCEANPACSRIPTDRPCIETQDWH